MQEQESEEKAEALAKIMRFVSALIEPDRLRIAGLLAAQPSSCRQLVERSGLREVVVQKHLAQLEQGGLARRSGASAAPLPPADADTVFELDREAIRALGPAIGKMQGRPAQRPTEARARTLATFFDDDGRLMSYPTRPVQYRWVLEAIAAKFEGAREYPEREVNEILKRINDDNATMRRALVDHGLMSRDHGIYRREWFPTEETADSEQA